MGNELFGESMIAFAHVCASSESVGRMLVRAFQAFSWLSEASYFRRIASRCRVSRNAATFALAASNASASMSVPPMFATAMVAEAPRVSSSASDSSSRVSGWAIRKASSASPALRFRTSTVPSCSSASCTCVS